MIRSQGTRLIVGAACLVLAACSPDGGVATTADQATVPPENTTSSVVATPAYAAVTSTTVAPSLTVPIPEDYPGFDELAGGMRIFAKEFDAQISSYIAVSGNEEDLAGLDVAAGIFESMTITYYSDVTVWDYPEGFREVEINGEFLYQAEDGTWQDSDRFEWPPFGPLPEWDFAQATASSCVESDPEQIGAEEIAGVVTLHLKCGFDESGVDVWVDQNGLVMKLVIEEAEPGTSLLLQTVWEVTALDVEPDGPLPPGA